MKKIYLQIASVIGIILIGAASYWAGSQSSDKTMAGATNAAGQVGGQSAGGKGGGGKGGGGKGGGGKGGGGGGGGNGGGGIAVSTAVVASRSLPMGISAVGSLRSDEAVIIRPEVSGRISEILFTEGQHVEKGVVLIRFDTTVQRAELEQAQASFALNKNKLDRAIDLQNKGFISSQARDEAENNFRVSQAALDLSKAKIAKLELHAPFAGTIGLRSVSIGDYVKDGQDIVNLESIDTLKADFKVPEIYLSQIHTGQALQIALDAIPGKTFSGQVFAINPLVDQNGRSVLIRAAVSNINGQLRPGMFARIRLFTKQNVDALTVPEQAIMPTGDDFFIFKVVDNKAQRNKVELGQRRDGNVEITRGLALGDVIVIEGQFKLREGATVHSIDKKPDTNAANATAGAALGDIPPSVSKAGAKP